MNPHPHASSEERQSLHDGADTPSMRDEKKLLEERRRRLEQSLHQHVEELKDRGRHIGKLALAGGAVLAGVWLVVKAVGAISARRDHRRALKAPYPAGALAADASATAVFPQATTTSGKASPAANFAAQTPRAVVAPVREPSLFQTVIHSEVGKMVAGQLVSLAMVFVTRKLEELLKIDRGADIGTVKESDLASHRIVDPVSAATVVDDDAPAARPHVRNSPPDASA